MLVEQLIKVEKWHSAKKRKKCKISTFATFSTTLSDNFQQKSKIKKKIQQHYVIISKKIQLLYFELFGVGPAMNLQYLGYSFP